MTADHTPPLGQDVYAEIRETLLRSRRQTYNAINFAMVQAYWRIGRIIVEHEQKGKLRAEYGKAMLKKERIGTATSGVWNRFFRAEPPTDEKVLC